MMLPLLILILIVDTTKLKLLFLLLLLLELKLQLKPSCCHRSFATANENQKQMPATSKLDAHSSRQMQGGKCTKFNWPPLPNSPPN